MHALETDSPQLDPYPTESPGSRLTEFAIMSVGPITSTMPWPHTLLALRNEWSLCCQSVLRPPAHRQHARWVNSWARSELR